MASEAMAPSTSSLKYNMTIEYNAHNALGAKIYIDLGDLTLFLDYRSSIARSLSRGGYKNKLYLPRLHYKADATDIFYYSMESGKHNSHFKSLKEPYNCVWFEPNLGCH